MIREAGTYCTFSPVLLPPNSVKSAKLLRRGSVQNKLRPIHLPFERYPKPISMVKRFLNHDI